MIKIGHNKQSFFELDQGDTVFVGTAPYVIEIKNEEGGMGFVLLLRKDYTRVDPSISALGSKLALKALSPHIANKDTLRMFHRELTVWAGFRHQNIVTLLDILDGGEAGWIAAMDWQSGSLAKLMATRGKLSVKECCHIMFQVISGLEYAYKEGSILHLDLKPANVLYTFDMDADGVNKKASNEPALRYRFKISDWGLATIKATNSAFLPKQTTGNTFPKHTSNRGGTEGYKAPERYASGVSSSIASDVFSLGIMFYQMLTGAFPWADGILPRYSITSGHYLEDARLSLDSLGVPIPIGDLVLSMIAFKPEQRPNDYRSIEKILIKTSRTESGWWANLIS